MAGGNYIFSGFLPLSVGGQLTWNS